MRDIVVQGCSNTVWKRQSSQSLEIWSLEYNDSFKNQHPLTIEGDSYKGVIAWFLIRENEFGYRHLLLLPEKLINVVAENILQWYYEKPAYTQDGDMHLKSPLPDIFLTSNTYNFLYYAMYHGGSRNPEFMFNNFFEHAGISSADLSGFYPLSEGDNWEPSSKIPQGFPLVYRKNHLIMTQWDKLRKGDVLASSHELDFCEQETLPMGIYIASEWFTEIKNTGNLIELNTTRNPLKLMSKESGYWFKYVQSHDLNTVKINKAMYLESLYINLPSTTSFDISGAYSLEYVSSVRPLHEFKCHRVMRSMKHDKDCYQFIKNLFDLELPLAKNVDIKMGFFHYVGLWAGLREYILEFFDWLDHRSKR